MKSKMYSRTQNRVLGVDPGFDRCGVAVVEKGKLLFSTCITTNPKDAHGKRLGALGAELAETIKKWKPDSLAIEKLFFNQNVRTALKVAEARGVILYEAARAGLGVYEYSPQNVKIAVTGYGKAEKGQVEAMTLRILSLKKAPEYDDEADAMALCITHIASYKGI